MTLLEEWLIAPHLRLIAWEPPSLEGSRRLSLARALASTEGREGAKDRVQDSVDREPEARVSPQAPSSGGGHAQPRPGSFA